MDDTPRYGNRTILAGAIVLIAVSFFGGRVATQTGVLPATTTAEQTKDGIDVSTVLRAQKLLDENFAPASTTLVISKDKKLWGAISGLTQAYGDPYTVFFPPKEKSNFETIVRGDFQGVGMEIAIKDGFLTVMTPLKDSPAFKAGIKSGDLVLQIDGKDTTGISVEDAVDHIRGPGGTQVKLTLSRNKGKPFDVTVTRATIVLPTIDTKLRDDGVFVIQLYTFNAQAAQLFRDAVKEFASTGSNKMIIDLRGDPGGYLEVAVDIASWFLPVGAPIVTEDFAGKQENQVHRSRGYDVFTDKLRLAILIDAGSASASEILSGALHDNGKATLVGEKSFGKGSVQQVFDLTSDSALKITIARWLTPNGISISHEGITPDIKAPRTEEDFKAGRDPQMDAAVNFLLGKSQATTTAAE